jgi:hypothetical protein
MKTKRRSKQSSSSNSANRSQNNSSLGQTSSRPKSKQKKQKKHRQQQQRMPGDDAIVRRDAQKYHDLNACMQRSFERSMREDRSPRHTTGSSSTHTSDTSSRTGVFYDDEAFWVIYHGKVIATAGSAGEGRDILNTYRDTCKQR